MPADKTFREQATELLAKINHATLERVETSIIASLIDQTRTNGDRFKREPDATDVRLLWTIIQRQAAALQDQHITGAEYVEITNAESLALALIPKTPEGFAQIEDLIREQKLIIEREKIKLAARNASRAQRLSECDAAESLGLRRTKIRKESTEAVKAQRVKMTALDRAIASIVAAGLSEEAAKILAKGGKVI